MSPFKTAHLPQGPVQYQMHGSGQPVVFVHGLLVDSKLWEPLLPYLGRGLRCILPNWPLGAHADAHAMSADADLSVPGMARLVADFLAALGLQDVILVGNDSGGALAQMVCARFPERISALVLTTCDAYDVFPPAYFSYLRWMGLVPGAAWISAQLLHHIPWLRRLPMTFGELSDHALPDQLVTQWLQPMRTSAGVRRDVKAFTRSLSTRHTEAAATTLRGFAKPVLLLWSTHCRHFPRRLAERFQRELPNAELQWVESRGVFLSLDHPEMVAASIKRFCLKVAADRAEPQGASESVVS